MVNSRQIWVFFFCTWLACDLLMRALTVFFFKKNPRSNQTFSSRSLSLSLLIPFSSTFYCRQRGVVIEFCLASTMVSKPLSNPATQRLFARRPSMNGINAIDGSLDCLSPATRETTNRTPIYGSISLSLSSSLSLRHGTARWATTFWWGGVDMGFFFSDCWIGRRRQRVGRWHFNINEWWISPAVVIREIKLVVL